MENNRISESEQNNVKLQRIIYWFFGILEVILGFRLVFKLLGANPSNLFVEIIYGIAGAFLAPFGGIFKSVVSNGSKTSSVLEPATIIAITVYGLVAYGCVKLVEILVKNKSVD